MKQDRIRNPNDLILGNLYEIQIDTWNEKRKQIVCYNKFRSFGDGQYKFKFFNISTGESYVFYENDFVGPFFMKLKPI